MPQRRVRAALVVLAPPRFDFALRVFQTQEPVRIQAFLAQPPVERFRVGVVRWLSRTAEIQCHSVFIGPPIDRLRNEFRATRIDFGAPRSDRNPVQNLHDH